ncbi:MAG TPA: PDZ domain-containing protein [Thermoanaerobaculaceae bacterium]|nr:PDZ domain-containing protein [Thermoanaerobaculaceae bacterium]
MRRVPTLLLVMLFVCAAVPALAVIDARLARQPAVSATQIAFVYAGDVWIAPKAGGVAERLSTPPGEESFPRFSPDGSLIAFTGSYDGNEDIYVMPAGGGVPKRVTHHPSTDRMLNWYPDAKAILYASPMASGSQRFNQLYKLSVEGGLPERLPVPYGEFAEISPDGKTLAFVPSSQDFRTWKRYRGGWVSRIWLFDLTTHASKRVGDDGASYSQPMWHGATLYFLSDRDANKRNNIWALDTKTDKMHQVTAFSEYDVHFPSIGPSDIVFENGGRLYLLDLAKEKAHEVKVEVVTDRSTIKPQLEKVAELVAWADISPSGKRAVFEARGDVFSIPAEHGPIYDLTRTAGFAERSPAWSPDGKQVAYWSDRTGEYELVVRNADGSGGERTVTKLGPGFRYHIFWSPDSTKLVFADQAMNINLCDVATGAVTRIDKGLFMFESDLRGFTPSWSADSRWVAFARNVERANGAIFLYDTQEKKLTQATSGFYDDGAPVFDPEGTYLYYVSGRTFQPSYGDADNTWIYANTNNLVAVPLRVDVPSPLAARNDVEEGKKDEKKDEGKKEEAKKPEGGDKEEAAKPEKDEKGEKKADKAAKPEPVKIDLANFEERVVILPPKAGRYADLQALPGKLFFRRLARTASGEEKTPIVFYDLKEREEKTVLADADAYKIAAGGEKILVAKKKDFAIIDPKPEQKMEKKLATSELEMTVNPVEEWHQIFNDAWRFERDYFYDPNLHGVDWNEMRTRYAALLDQCVTRYDVNFVLGELIAELNSSHTYRGGGDLEKAEKRGVGLLGVDFSLENGAYRFKKIYDGAPWDAEVRSPLLEPGLKVKEGDYLLAVDGAKVDTTQDPWAAFDGLAEKDVMLTVNDKPTMEGSRSVLVKTLESEARLRNLAWINANRLKVEKATGGKIAYIYVPNTGRDGQTELYRQFNGQLRKDGVIVDERFNAGGQIPDRFVELLNRPITNYWAVRDGMDWQWPPTSIPGPRVMLINGWSGSGGDCFPLYFRMAGLGPLIGRRTWGGLIGISGVPDLIDGGNVTVPTFGIYSLDSKWIVEGHGVEPDIDVMDDPAKMWDGGDPQLDRAIDEVMRLYNAKPPVVPKRPAYENRAGK